MGVKKFFDHIYGQSDKQNFGLSGEFFYMKNILIDQTAWAGRIKIFFVFKLLRYSALQNDQQFKEAVLMGAAGIEFMKNILLDTDFPILHLQRKLLEEPAHSL